MFKTVKIRDGHDNFFTPLRLIFALMVLIGHAYIIAERDPAAEPFLFFDYKPSYLAVNLFFIASGFLVTKSMLYRKDMAEFTSARFLRIFPGLFVHMLFVMLLMGPFVTSLPLWQFITHPDFWTQPFKVMTFYETNMILPGALETNEEQIGSAPLWTLRYEVLAYIGTAIAFALGLMKRNWMLIAQFLIFVALWPLAHMTGLYEKVPATIQSLLRFGLCYGLGAAIFALRDKISFHIIGIPVLGILAALTNGTVLLFEIMTNIWLGYFIFWAAYVTIPFLNGLKSIDDVSYGIYIYHWAVMQWVFYVFPKMDTLTLIACGLPITLLLSYLSWIWVEKPSLSHKKSLANVFKRKKPNSAETIQPAE